jgi:hypothetical protein
MYRTLMYAKNKAANASKKWFFINLHFPPEYRSHCTIRYVTIVWESSDEGDESTLHQSLTTVNHLMKHQSSSDETSIFYYMYALQMRNESFLDMIYYYCVFGLMFVHFGKKQELSKKKMKWEWVMIRKRDTEERSTSKMTWNMYCRTRLLTTESIVDEVLPPPGLILPGLPAEWGRIIQEGEWYVRYTLLSWTNYYTKIVPQIVP